jgi:cytochrome c nitrite reductase small subunit
MNTRRIVKALFIITPAALIGLGAYTFFYAKGYSYLTNDPKACMNCHVMRDFYTAWEVSSHRSVTCNGCHVPHDPIRKYLVKADNGFWHSFAFTFENVQVFRLKPRGQKVVEENCVRCHATTVSTVFHGGDGKRCFDCHRGVGHAS